MGAADSTSEKERFYDVERLRQVVASQRLQPRPGRALRIARRVGLVLDSVEGFFVALLGLPIMFGGIAAVVTGSVYGPIAFIAVMGGSLGMLAFYIDRRVGRSLIFGDYSMLRRSWAQAVAFALAVAALYLLVVFSNFLNAIPTP